MDALERVEENMGLVYAAANRFPWADRREMVQSGCVGLMEAVRRFDDTRGVRFSSFAVPYILGEMRAYLRRDHAVHIPRTLQDASAKAARTAQELRGVLGREPTLNEISARLGIAPEELAAALESRAAPISLDAPVGEESDAPQFRDSIGDASQQLPFDRVLARDLIARCDEKERALLQLRYFRGMTQAQTAKALGVTQPQVSRMEKKLLERLRESTA
ncbi:MAG: sigma-70 family RNA polymerase sigma factor [Oscillospiraceae bacterium]|jgi:RNA polymerase sporulation-specific sigma factor|nr:sigma-70 family RNA polymerase sigma factor [Oscillospiraceae bacterium]